MRRRTIQAKQLKKKLIDEFEEGEIKDSQEAKKANNSNESTLRLKLIKLQNKTKRKPIKTTCLIPQNFGC